MRRKANIRARVDPDRRLLRRAARSIAVQTAAAVALVILAMAVAVLAFDEHQQHQQADDASRSAWSTADDVTDPPPHTYLVIRAPSGKRQITPGAPDPVAALDPDAVPNGRSQVQADGQTFVLYAGPRARLGRVLAVYALTTGELEERRLQLSLGLAAVIGVLGAALVGTLIGHRAVRPLGEALALQRRFVADASHELRTPLSVLLLRAQLLRRHLGTSATPQRAVELDRLVDDTKALSDVVNDLLLSVELRRDPRAGETIHALAVARDAVESLLPLAEQKGIALTVLADGPDTDEQQLDLLLGAPVALRRAVVSLVDNAIAHTPVGGHVRVSVAPAGDTITITVADDGEGLDPAQAHRLIERFSRGTATGAGRRFGLGLALVDEVARAHGGALVIDGRPGEGATFGLRLPAHRLGTDRIDPQLGLVEGSR
jgi:signal transduction histidine kinase